MHLFEQIWPRGSTEWKRELNAELLWIKNTVEFLQKRIQELEKEATELRQKLERE